MDPQRLVSTTLTYDKETYTTKELKDEYKSLTTEYDELLGSSACGAFPLEVHAWPLPGLRHGQGRW